jgi:Uncharacterised methyltransferase family (DUF6094)
VLVPPRSMGCLFLNPPYGDLIADRAETGSSKPFKSGRLRLEKMFFDRCIGSLQYGGLMILIVPYHVIDQEFASKIVSHCDDVTWYLAPEQQFKQAVIMGTRVRVRSPQKSLVQSLVNFGQGLFPIHACSVLPKTYSVPQVNAPCELRVIRIDSAQLIDELDKLGDRTLWNQFSNQFGVLQQVRRRWLCEPSQWHLALALAAGQVYGAIQGQDGRTLLIKGDTIKEKDCVVEQSVDDQGNVTEKRVMTDKFVPIITGLDFTAGRQSFGRVVTIR